MWPKPRTASPSKRVLRIGRRLTLSLLAATLGSLALITPVQSAAPTENDVLAAFVYQFTKYVTWPEARMADASQPFVIAVIGDKALFERIEDLTRGKKAFDRPIVVRSDNGVQPGKAAHIVVIKEESAPRDLATLRALRGCHCLTVTDREGLEKSGSVFSFYREQDRLRFRINRTLATEEGLEISSQLLKLAGAVE